MQSYMKVMRSAQNGLWKIPHKQKKFTHRVPFSGLEVCRTFLGYNRETVIWEENLYCKPKKLEQQKYGSCKKECTLFQYCTKHIHCNLILCKLQNNLYLIFYLKDSKKVIQIYFFFNFWQRNLKVLLNFCCLIAVE